MVFLVLIGVILVPLLMYYIKCIYSARYCYKIPPIKPIYPLLGNAPALWGKSSTKAFKFLCDSFVQTDRISRIMLGPVPLIFVNHPDLLKQIFLDTNLHDKPFFYEYMQLGHGLITERNGKLWLADRKALNPTFNTLMLTNFLPIMDKRAKKLVLTLDALADGQTEFNILKYVAECTLEIVFSTTMGRNDDELPGQKDYVRHMEVLTATVAERMINVKHYWDVFYWMSKDYKLDAISRKYCDAFVNMVISQRRAELEEEKKVAQKIDNFETNKLNFLDQILIISKEGDKRFTEQEVFYNFNTILAAAHETTALTISYLCLFLAMYPEIQEKVVTEMNEVFYDASVEITMDTLNQLECTQRVIKEVLRLCPAVPLGSRQTGSEILLDGVRIPKGQILTFNLYALHRRQDIWGPDPERFDPDRFLPEACAGRHPYAYLPFSAGMRNCIGYRYAMNSMRIMLLRILQNFEVCTSLKRSDIQHEFGISLKLVGYHSISLKKRNNNNVSLFSSIGIK